MSSVNGGGVNFMHGLLFMQYCMEYAFCESGNDDRAFKSAWRLARKARKCSDVLGFDAFLVRIPSSDHPTVIVEIDL
jgi:hypothetical protein